MTRGSNAAPAFILTAVFLGIACSSLGRPVPSPGEVAHVARGTLERACSEARLRGIELDARTAAACDAIAGVCGAPDR